MIERNGTLAKEFGNNLIGYGDNLEPADDDHTAKAIGMILLQSFLDMTSPSYWAKQIAGGDPKDELKRVIEVNETNRKRFLKTIDRSIEQTKAILKQRRPQATKS